MVFVYKFRTDSLLSCVDTLFNIETAQRLLLLILLLIDHLLIVYLMTESLNIELIIVIKHPSGSASHCLLQSIGS